MLKLTKEQKQFEATLQHDEKLELAELLAKYKAANPQLEEVPEKLLPGLQRHIASFRMAKQFALLENSPLIQNEVIVGVRALVRVRDRKLFIHLPLRGRPYQEIVEELRDKKGETWQAIKSSALTLYQSNSKNAAGL